MSGPTLDRTLQSNVATGVLLPRLDQAVGHGLKYLVQQLGATASDALRAFGLRRPEADPHPRVHLQPGNAVSMTAHTEGPNVHVKTARCAETGKDLELLPKKDCDKYKSYAGPISAAAAPERMEVPENFKDAFTQTVQLGNGETVDLLPPSLMNSSLLNYKLQHQLKTERSESIEAVKHEMKEIEEQIGFAEESIENIEFNIKANENLLKTLPAGTKKYKEISDGLKVDKNQHGIEKTSLEKWQTALTQSKNKLQKLQNDLEIANQSGSFRGKPQTISPNTLFDPLTGFAASIMVRDDREVVVSFSGMGSQGAGVGHAVRCFLNILGFTTPKNFSQASQLTQMVQKQIQELNTKLPPGAQPFTLKLAGHSMGGGMATYAALRNKERAVVFNPLRLGLLTRAKVGRPAMKTAKNLVTEVVVQTDWVSDNRMSKFYKLLNIPSLLLTGRKADTRGAIGNRYLVPLPSFDKLNNDTTNVIIENGKDREETIRKYMKDFNPHNKFADAIDIHSGSKVLLELYSDDNNKEKVYLTRLPESVNPSR